MSGETPSAGGFMRQRHSCGYASSGDELEDDACSRPPQPLPPSITRARSWIDVMENVLWISSAAFIVYFGDRHSNFIYLLLHDNRIRRMHLYLGLVGFLSNAAYFLYANISTCGIRKYNERWDLIGDSALPFVTIGFISFCLLTLALWPIWSFLTLPLVFTLFMACTVISPYFVGGTFKPPAGVFRTD